MREIALPARVRTWIRRATLVSGLAAVVLAVALVALQGVLPEPLQQWLWTVADTVGKSGVAWTLATFGGVYALWRVVRGRRRRLVAPELAEDPRETSSVEAPRVGNRFESVVVSHALSGATPTGEDDEIRDALVEVVVDVETRFGDRSSEEVRTAVEEGTWTDDRIAAAFLGGSPAPGFPLGARIRGWLRPAHAFERRVEHTAAVIHERTERLTADRTEADHLEVAA